MTYINPRVTGDRRRQYLRFFNTVLGAERRLSEVKMITELDAEGKPLAVVVFGRCTGANMELAIASRPEWKATRFFLRECFYYAFVDCGVKRVSAVINENNTKALKFNERLGLTREFEQPLKDFFPDGDGYLYSMRKEDCKWIRNLL